MVRTKPARRLAFVAGGEEVDQDNIGLSPLLGTFSFPRLLLSKNKIVGLGTKITPFTIAKFCHHMLRKYYGKPK